jgi:hypothetical protein
VLYRAPGALPRAAELLAEHIVHSLESATAMYGEPRMIGAFPGGAIDALWST